MAKLLEVVQSGNADTQETALGAIASAANAAGASFQPYVQAVFPVLSQYMEATDASMLKRRSRATEAMGLMATAVGKEVIGPLVSNIMQAALKVTYVLTTVQQTTPFGSDTTRDDATSHAGCLQVTLTLVLILFFRLKQQDFLFALGW